MCVCACVRVHACLHVQMCMCACMNVSLSVHKCRCMHCQGRWKQLKSGPAPNTEAVKWLFVSHAAQKFLTFVN